MFALRTFLAASFVIIAGSLASAEDLLGGELDRFVTKFNSAARLLKSDVLMATTACSDGSKVRTCKIISPGKVGGVLIAAEDRKTLSAVMLLMAGGTDPIEYGEAISATILMYAPSATPQDHAGTLSVLIQGIIDRDEKTTVQLEGTKWSLTYGEAAGYMLLISAS